MDLNLHGTDDQLELYALGRLPESDLPFIEEHLMVCEACREHLESIENFALGLRDALAISPASATSRPPLRAGIWEWIRGLVRQPVFGMAAAAAVLIALVAVYPLRNREIAPVAALQLTAIRGEMPSSPRARETDLTLADAAPEGAPFRIAVYDADGRNVWNGKASVVSEGAQVRITERLNPGRYFVRLYSAESTLLHEYGFIVNK